ncbi:MAG: glycosyltransferase family 4 protein [Chloroflexi bacterium]|nr:MAG: glycosyltransferase family 4 protein [Chloroflexota bacterium]
MRVAFDAHTIGQRDTGNEAYTLNLLRALTVTADPRQRYDVLTPHPQELVRLVPLPSGFEAIAIRPGTSAVRIPIGIPMAALRRGADVLHMSYVGPPWAPCPTVITVHDLSYLASPELHSPRTRVLLRLLVGASVRRAAAVIAISEWTRRDLIHYYRLPPERVTTIHLAPSSTFHAVEGLRPDRLPPGVREPFILAVGTLEPRKNLRRLVEAFAVLVRQNAFDGTLVLSGKPGFHAAELRSAVEACGLSGRVAFTGYVTDQVLNVLYNRAQALVYPSLYEGFGLPVMEAMACGCPVIASNATAIPEVAGDAALLVDPTSVASIAQAMRAVLQRPDLARDLRVRGIRQAAGYSWERTARQTQAIYDQVAREGRRAAA